VTAAAAAGPPVRPLAPAGFGSAASVALSDPEPAPGPEPGAGELVRRWLLGRRSEQTRRAYGRDLGLWLAWCGQLAADPLQVQRPGRETGGVSRSHVEAWARMLEAAGAPAVTIARRISAVSSWYDWLRRAEYVTTSPVADVERPAVDRDTSTTPGLTRGQAAALLATADTDLWRTQLRTAAITAVLLYCGCRVGELLGADTSDLGHDRGHRTLTVVRKGGKRQPLALPAPAAARLDAYLAERQDLDLAGDLVAAVPVPAGLAGAGGRTGRPLITTATGWRLDAGSVWRLLRRLARTTPELAPLAERLSAHVLRHSYATLALDAGVSLRGTCKMPSGTPNPAPPAATTAPAAASIAARAARSLPTSPVRVESQPTAEPHPSSTIRSSVGSCRAAG